MFYDSQVIISKKDEIFSPKKLLSSGVPPKDVAMDLGISIPTLYRWIPAASLDH